MTDLVTKPTDVTVILCSYNRAAMLRQTLNTLVKLDHQGFSYEILVVDDASTDETPEVVQDFIQNSGCKVRYIRAEGKGPSHARNQGLAASESEWIAYFDDDQLADPQWLQALYQFAVQNSVRCVGGARLLHLAPEVLESLSHTSRMVLGEMSQGDMPHKCGRKPLLATGTVLIHRSVFDELGNFDETLIRGGEDLDLFRRMYSAGVEAWFEPKSICYHLIPEYRLEKEYQSWTSLRNGENFAIRDGLQQGRLRACVNGVLRTGQTVGIHMPLGLLAKLRRDKAAALGYRCRVWRTLGYVRGCVSLMIPKWASNTPFLSQLTFRSERSTLGAAKN